jgi:predicted DNA-binding WGR domain protein
VDVSDRILGEEGPERNRTRFYLNSYEGNRLLDIRKFYRDRKTGEFKPKRQGINLNRDTFMELKRVLDRDEDLILEWLRIGHVPEEVLRYQQAQEEAKKKNFRLVGEVDIEEVNNFRDLKMFDVRHEGGRDIVELNSAHAFVQSISEEELAKMTPTEIRGLFARVFAAFGRSRTLLLGGGASEPEILFEQSVFDWSEFTAEFVVRK